MSQLPEELEAMAWLYGQSRQIDSMVVDSNAQLVTNSNTIRHQIDAYSKQQRQHQIQPTPHSGGYVHTPSQNDLSPSPQVASQPHYDFTPHQNPDPPSIQIDQTSPKESNQLEFNLEPDKVDIIINLLKEINIKFGKLLKSFDEKNTTEKKPVSKIFEKHIYDK
jgi:hypothetical protein